MYVHFLPASVAQSDTRPTGDQVARSIPTRSATFVRAFVDVDHEIFSTVVLSLPLIQEGQFLAEE